MKKKKKNKDLKNGLKRSCCFGGLIAFLHLSEDIQKKKNVLCLFLPPPSPTVVFHFAKEHLTNARPARCPKC